jgi:hypothetical protein
MTHSRRARRGSPVARVTNVAAALSKNNEFVASGIQDDVRFLTSTSSEVRDE